MAIDKALMSELKQKLLAEKAHLEVELARLGKPTGSIGDYETTIEEIGTDPDENATEVEGYVDNLGVESNLEGQLRDVLAALKKMDQGTYGVCEKTGKEISIERLRAYPAARTAI